MHELRSIDTTEEDTALARRIEEASLNAWPAMQQTFLDGWILRFARGFTKRSNSIVPLYDPLQTSARNRPQLAEKIRHCENLYAREQLQTVFRLTSIRADDLLDEVLDDRGYTVQDESLVLTRELTHPSAMATADVRFLPLQAWLENYCRLTSMPEPARSLHGVILNGISGECGFGMLYVNDIPVACGLAVVDRDLSGLFDVFTDPDHRDAGLGSHMVQALLDWSWDNGARTAYLQMVASNEPAAHLYERLDFRQIYRYWYRVAP